MVKEFKHILVNLMKLTNSEKDYYKQISSLDSLCTTWRHDFGLLSEEEKEKTRCLLRQLWEHHVRPIYEKLDQMCVKTFNCPVCQDTKMIETPVAIPAGVEIPKNLPKMKCPFCFRE